MAATIVVPSSSSAGEPELDWWQTERDLINILQQQKKHISGLAKEALATKSATAKDAMFRVSVFMRAGMSREAIAALGDLKRLAPDLESHQISGIYYDAIDKLSEGDVAKALVEIFKDEVYDLSLESRLLLYLTQSGESFESIDQWMAHMPKGKENFWVKERLRFNIANKRGEALVKSLEAEIRNNPDDIKSAIAFLDALRIAGRIDEKPWDVAWMANVVKPKLATEASDLAGRLKNLESFPAAVVFFKQAVATPITDPEIKQLAMMYQAILSPETMKLGFAEQVREQMAECLLKEGKNDEAQKWMVEAADIREKNGVGNPFLAGQVQTASGQRVIEGRIKEKEKESEDDPQYWQRRAGYYRGRNETAQEEEALKKALALTVPQADPDGVLKKGSPDMRNWVLSEYVMFLKRVNRQDEAVALLHKELQEAPAETRSAQGAAGSLAFEFTKHITVDDEVLWTWLSNRLKWEYNEERPLWVMLEASPKESLEKYLVRAEGLVRGQDPSRAKTLGWIMNRMGFPARSIPLLKDAAERLQDADAKKSAAFALFESYLDTNDWRNAEAIFPDTSRQLTPQEISSWYGSIALTALKAGAKDDALRIWKSVTGINPGEMNILSELSRLGLHDELVKFYEEMLKSMPLSDVPGRAFGILKAK